MPHQLNTDNLREAAASLGDLTRYAIAKRTGVSQSTVHRLLNGECQPTAATQGRLIDAYQIPIDQLMTSADEQVAA
jgi:transcriptional regulator with XRE-family HTH domain